jgi:hypothetical protein
MKSSVVPLVWAAQVTPPSVDLRIVPEVPTTQNVLASVYPSPRSATLTPLARLVHVVPPSDVVRMSPLSPAITHVFVSVQMMS